MCCVAYQFGRFRWIDANFIRIYVCGIYIRGCVDGCSEEATHLPLLPRTTFAEKYNMEYVGSTYGRDAVLVSAMRFIDRKDNLSISDACLFVKK